MEKQITDKVQAPVKIKNQKRIIKALEGKAIPRSDIKPYGAGRTALYPGPAFPGMAEASTVRPPAYDAKTAAVG